MDVLTHAFLPYAVLHWAKRPNAERRAAFIGGLAPDLDSIWAWTTSLDESLYPLIHRGFSHTFWGAPLLATILLWVASRPVWARRWTRFQGFRFQRSVAPFLLFGAWSHLVLDGLTITGTPALWPFSDHRFTTNWFFFSVPYLLVVSAVLLVPILRGRAKPRWIHQGLVLALVLLALAGGARYATYPHDAPPGAHVTPGSLDWQWTVSERNDTGVLVYQTTFGRAGDTVFFPEPNRTFARDAIQACEDHPYATPWIWNLWGLAVVDASQSADGAWDLRFRDSVRLFNEAEGNFGGIRALFGTEDENAMRCHVTREGLVSVQRGAGGIFGG